MKRLLANCLLIAACATAPLSQSAPIPDDEAAVAQIAQVVRAFQAAIIAKDRAALEAMFLASDNSWLMVAGEPARLKPGLPWIRPDSYKNFAEFVGNSKVPVEERFYDVRIHSNGAVGTVYFNFDFLMDGKVTNDGSESWHLVRTENGWKISSMVYSIGRPAKMNG